jgi:LacI family transcriptional regulator
MERVVQAAAAAGYQRNLLAGTVMSHQRRSRGLDFRGVIGVLDLFPASRSPCAQEFAHAVLIGIDERANAMGFKAERFVVGENGITLKRLGTILFIRGVQALVILPAAELPDSADLTWHRYAVVYVDHFIDRPVLHSVCSDHYRSMVALLHETHHRGYRRPGLILEDSTDERKYSHWEAAFLALQKSFPGIVEVPPLRVVATNKSKFREWFEAYNPDVVLDHVGAALDWMRRSGARVPETGYVCLNSTRSPQGSARLDLRPVQIGARAAELVAAQLLHNKMGIPEQPSLTSMPAHFIDGCSLPFRNSEHGKVDVCAGTNKRMNLPTAQRSGVPSLSRRSK